MSTAPPLTLTLDGLHPADVRRVMRAHAQGQARAALWARYRALTEAGVKATDAQQRLADEEGITYEALGSRLWPRKRARRS